MNTQTSEKIQKGDLVLVDYSSLLLIKKQLSKKQELRNGTIGLVLKVVKKEVIGDWSAIETSERYEVLVGPEKVEISSSCLKKL